MSGIVTVTLAAAIDLTYHVDRVAHGRVNRASSWSRELSGKGVNVSHAVAASARTTRAVVALSDDAAGFAEADWLAPVRVRGATRVNITFSEGDGVTTKVNAPSPALTADEADAVVRRTRDEVRAIGADWVVIAGTVPPSADGELSLGELIRTSRAEGARVAVDTSGPALDRVLADDIARVALLKPNTHELAEVAGRPLRTIGEVVDAARGLVRRGCETVYVSMGEDGALAVTADGTWWARATAPAVVNATGAGDASLAGFLVHAGPGSPNVPEALRGAASYGALSVSQRRTLLQHPDTAPDAELVVDPDPARPLRDPAA